MPSGQLVLAGHSVPLPCVVQVRVGATAPSTVVIVASSGSQPVPSGFQYCPSGRCSVIVTLTTPLVASYAVPVTPLSSPDAICAALKVSPIAVASPSEPTSLMRDVGGVRSTLIETVVVAALFAARSVAVPFAVVAVVSAVIVQVLVTVTGPVTPAPPGALGLPSAAVPDATHPLSAIPDAPSEHVKVTRTLLVY